MPEKTFKVLIVDDEPESRNLLHILINQIHGVEAIENAGSVDDALRKVYKYEPDLILLDIKMPGQSGFDLVEKLRMRGMDIPFIFITAFDQYAIDAIKAAAFDYLLKPVGLEELEESLARLRYSSKHKIHTSSKQKPDTSIVKNIKINTRSGYLLIDPAEIVCCLADGNYTTIHLSDNRKEMISSRIGEFQSKLASKNFIRISRSAIINILYLIKVDTKNRSCILKHHEQPLPVSKERLADLKARCS